MPRLYNLARMTTATTGTGTITLGSAVSGFLSFDDADVQDGETVTYAIQDGSNSEIGRGVYTASGTTLSRSVLKSTNSDAEISLSGSAQVFITPAAEDFLTVVNAQTGASYSIVTADFGKLVTLSNSGAVAVSIPQATGAFATGWRVSLLNLGSGDVTVTPTTSTIGGDTSITLVTGQSVTLVSDGTNWLVVGLDAVVLDEDDFASDSATGVPTQQSVKAYVDAGQPTFLAFTNGSTAVSQNAWTKATLATPTESLGDSSYASSRVTIGANDAGRWAVVAAVALVGSSVGARIYKNGVASAIYSFASASSSASRVGSAAGLIDVADEDYLELYVYHNGSGSSQVPVATASYIALWRVGDAP